MPSTIQVSGRTLQLLQRMKREAGAKSYDQVIRQLIIERKEIPKSMFGSNTRLTPFTAAEEAETHEL